MQNYVKIIFGNILLGFAYAKWMKPNGIINGGVTSLSMIGNKALHIHLLYLSNGITLLLLLISLIFLGKENFKRSCLSSVCYNLFFSLFYLMPGNFQINLPMDVILSCLFIGFGYYYCISTNASTVGVDVIAIIIHKKTGKNLALMLRYINYSVLLLGLLVYGIKSIVVGLIFTFIHTKFLNFLLQRHYQKSKKL